MMSEPTRGRIDLDGLFQMLLAIGRALGVALFMIYLFGGLLAGLTMLIVELFVDLGDEWTRTSRTSVNKRGQITNSKAWRSNHAWMTR